MSRAKLKLPKCPGCGITIPAALICSAFTTSGAIGGKSGTGDAKRRIGAANGNSKAKRKLLPADDYSDVSQSVAIVSNHTKKV